MVPHIFLYLLKYVGVQKCVNKGYPGVNNPEIMRNVKFWSLTNKTESLLDQNGSEYSPGAFKLIIWRYFHKNNSKNKKTPDLVLPIFAFRPARFNFGPTRFSGHAVSNPPVVFNRTSIRQRCKGANRAERKGWDECANDIESCITIALGATGCQHDCLVHVKAKFDCVETQRKLATWQHARCRLKAKERAMNNISFMDGAIKPEIGNILAENKESLVMQDTPR